MTRFPSAASLSFATVRNKPRGYPSTALKVPLFASRASLEPLLPEIAERQRAVLESGSYILGPEVESFESEFAAYLGVDHCVGVANGTERSRSRCGRSAWARGTRWSVPSVSFFATVEPVVTIGATPVFCDVDEETWCMTAATAEPRSPIEPGAASGPPLRQSGAGRRADGSGGASADKGAGGRRAGSRCHAQRADGRGARRRGDLQLLPLQEPGWVRRRRRRRHGRSRGGGGRPPASLPRIRGQAAPHGGRIQLPPRRDPGGRAQGPPRPPRRLDRGPAPRGGGVPGGRAGGDRPGSGRDAWRGSPPGTSSSSRPRSASSCSGR